MKTMSPRWTGKVRWRRGRPVLKKNVWYGHLWYRGKKLLLIRHGTVGINAFEVRGGQDHFDLSLYFAAWQRLKKMKRKRKLATASEVLHLAPVETNIFGKVMSIVSHMADLKYDDGESRAPGTVMIKTMGSAWVVTVKDPDECLQLNVIQATLDDALTLTALLLESDNCPWETDSWAVAARAKKRK